MLLFFFITQCDIYLLNNEHVLHSEYLLILLNTFIIWMQDCWGEYSIFRLWRCWVTSSRHSRVNLGQFNRKFPPQTFQPPDSPALSWHWRICRSDIGIVITQHPVTRRGRPGALGCVEEPIWILPNWFDVSSLWQIVQRELWVSTFTSSARTCWDSSARHVLPAWGD